ncbi:MAG: phenylalanine--tRNA ligase subunit beta [Conexivisphaera sp.]
MAKGGSKLPVVEVDLRRLAALTAWHGSPEDLLDVVPYAGLDIESVEGYTARLEYSPNRPDFATEWGIAHYLRGLTGVELGPAEIPLSPSGVLVSADPALRGIRPYVAGLVSKGLKLDDDSLRQLIRMQEDLHEGLGRHRRRVAIGLHDLDRITPPIRYVAVGGDHAFVPLGESRSWTVKSILEEHELGRKYGSGFSGTSLYPALIDSAGNTLSFPPIINGEHTRVHGGTRSLFVDVTGTSLPKVMDALSVLALTLHEMKARIEYISVDYGDLVLRTPDLSSRELYVSASRASSLLGLDLKPSDLAEYLGRSRIGVREVLRDGVVALIPRYRFDVMHEVDLVEEVAYGYGYSRLSPEQPREPGIGELSPASLFDEMVRDVATGMGMQEVITTHLTSYNILYRATGRSPEHSIRVLSSKSSEHEYIRDSLIPGLLYVLSTNVHEEYPQRIFEVGVVARREGTSAGEHRRFAVAVAHAKANFTEVKSIVDTLVRSLLGTQPSYSASGCAPPFIDGRCASTSLSGVELGVLGEIAPSTLEQLHIQVPVAAAELDVDILRALCGMKQ